MTSLLDFTNLNLGREAQPEPTPSTSTPSESQSPIQTRHATKLLNNIPTEILVQAYSDRIFILITQLGRIGSLVRSHLFTSPPQGLCTNTNQQLQIQVNPPPPNLPSPISNPAHSLFPSLPAPHPSTTLLPLFGVPPSIHMRAIYELYATMAGTIVFKDVPEGDRIRPVLLGIALKPGKEDEEAGVTDSEREMFGEVMQLIKECRVW